MAFGMKHVYMYPEGDGAAGGGAAGAAGAAGAGGGGGEGSGAAAGNAGGQGQQAQGQQGQQGQQQAQEPRWPEQWREMYAKGPDGKVDEGKLAHLKRYTDPTAALESFVQLQKKINAGELRPVLGKDASPEAMQEYRKANGIPEAADKYELKLREGLIVGDADKPFVQSFLAKVHGKNVSNEQASAFVEAYYDIITEQQKTAAETRAKTEQAVTAALGAKWGADFKPNMNRIASMLDARVDDPKLRELVDGALKTNQPFAELLEGLAREINPASTILPEGVNADVGGIETEIKKIEDIIRNKRDDYNRDEAMQERYRKLLSAREQMQQKAA